MNKISEARILFWCGITAVKLGVAFVLSILLLWLLPVINLLIWLGFRPDSPSQERVFSLISFGIFCVAIYTITSILFNRAKKSLGWKKKKAVEKSWKNIPNTPSTLTKEDFDRILIEEGILSEEHRTEIWEGRPRDWSKAGDEITEMGLRKSAKAYLKRYPESAKKDPPANDS